MKIITLGNGFIAGHLPYEIANYRLLPSKENISNFIDQYKPDIIVNGIGFCGSPNVDQCQTEKSKTYMSNVILPLMLAEKCEKHDIKIVHLGSGCINFGQSPNKLAVGTTQYAIEVDLGWRETDHSNPQSYYSKTKYACDLVIGEMKNVVIIRLRMPISWKNNPRNFINKVKNYKQIIDIPNSVTFIDDLVRVVDWVIQNNKTGIYHTTNPEPLSAADVMREYQKYVPEHRFDIITEQELDKLTTSKRSNCILNTDKLTNEGFQMTPTKEALEKCMSRYFKELQ